MLSSGLCDHVSNDEQVDGVLLCHKAELLQNGADKILLSELWKSIKVLKEWLDRFQKRLTIRFCCVHGKASTAENIATNATFFIFVGN